MYKGLTFLGLIPARGGSKGIPRKNILPVLGRPLIQYTIDAALGSRYLDRVIVSTDCQEISATAKACGAEVPFMRPPQISDDGSPTIDAILHAIRLLAQRDEKYDAVVLLQPTQPLRNETHIDESIRCFHDHECRPVASVCQVEEHPVLMRTIDSAGHLNPILRQSSTVRRQDFSAVYKVNGAIYINKTATLHQATSLNDNCIPYVMERANSLDIDTLEDARVLEEELLKAE